MPGHESSHARTSRTSGALSGTSTAASAARRRRPRASSSSGRVTAQKIRGERTGRSCCRFEGDTVALAFQEEDRAPGKALPVLAVVVVTTEFAVHSAVGQDVIDDS
jgi:hypothetical protein